MKYLLIIVAISIGFPCLGQSFKKRYKEKLESESKLISSAANYTLELLSNGNYIFKRYYPENKTITHLVSYKTDKFKVKHGLYQERYDDGTLVCSGMYSNNQKVGEWRENLNQRGYYVDNLKEGSWKIYNKDSIVLEETNYLNNEYHGKLIRYDSIGQIIMEHEFKHGELMSTSLDTTFKIIEEMPMFPGCDEQKLLYEELNTCSKNKLLEYIYRNMRYPRKARELNIQGKALIQFVVDENGETRDLKVLNGVSRDIKKEVAKLINKMPLWTPGMQNGKPVKVLYTLPINFKLE